MEQNLAERDDVEELTDTKFGGVHLMDSQLTTLPIIPLVWYIGISLLIKQ